MGVVKRAVKVARVGTALALTRVSYDDRQKYLAEQRLERAKLLAEVAGETGMTAAEFRARQRAELTAHILERPGLHRKLWWGLVGAKRSLGHALAPLRDCWWRCYANPGHATLLIIWQIALLVWIIVSWSITQLWPNHFSLLVCWVAVAIGIGVYGDKKWESHPKSEDSTLRKNHRVRKVCFFWQVLLTGLCLVFTLRYAINPRWDFVGVPKHATSHSAVVDFQNSGFLMRWRWGQNVGLKFYPNQIEVLAQRAFTFGGSEHQAIVEFSASLPREGLTSLNQEGLLLDLKAEKQRLRDEVGAVLGVLTTGLQEREEASNFLDLIESLGETRISEHLVAMLEADAARIMMMPLFHAEFLSRIVAARGAAYMPIERSIEFSVR